MTPHLGLLGVLVVLIAVLEVLNGYFEALLGLQKIALEEAIELGRGAKGLISKVWLGLRVSVAKLLGAIAFISLYFHELMHALVQLASGAKPRIVLCKNGGYAEARPWMNSGAYNLVVALGMGLTGGICGMAPLLGGSAAIYLCAYFLVPLEPGTLGMLGDSVASASSTGAIVSGLFRSLWFLVTAIASAKLWVIATIVLVTFILGRGLTPSSTDFYNAAPHLLAYALAYLTAVALLPNVWLLIGLGLIGIPLYLFALLRIRRFGIPWLISGYTLSCGAIGVLAGVGVFGDSPAAVLAGGLSSMLVALLLAASLYVMFLVVLFGLALLNSPSTAFLNAKQGSSGPGVFASLVTTFDTCTSCKIHFRGKCDGCGRTSEQIRVAENSP